MKPIKELRNQLNFYPQEIASSIRYFSTLNIDWDVHLSSINKNLQRPFVWDLNQKRELINSIIIGRHIPHCAVVCIVNPNDNNSEIFQIIDGKQRLSTTIGFYNNSFTILLENKEYYFNELPQDYQSAIRSYTFRYYIVNDTEDNLITDLQKITWFKFINFAGTPQEIEHLNELSKLKI